MRMSLAAVVLAVMPVTAMAETRMYECTMKNLAPAMGWITEKYFVLYDDAVGTAKVEDAITQHVVGKPVEAKVTGKTDQKVAFVWAVQSKDSGSQQVKMQYRAAVYVDGTVTITARPAGYGNMFEARGTCTVKKAKG